MDSGQTDRISALTWLMCWCCVSVVLCEHEDSWVPFFRVLGDLKVEDGHCHLILSVDLGEEWQNHLQSWVVIQQLGKIQLQVVGDGKHQQRLRRMVLDRTSEAERQWEQQSFRLRALYSEVGLTVPEGIGREKRGLVDIFGFLIYGMYTTSQLASLAHHQGIQDKTINELAKLVKHESQEIDAIQDRVNTVTARLEDLTKTVIDGFASQSVEIYQERLTQVLLDRHVAISELESTIRRALSGQFPTHVAESFHVVQASEELLQEVLLMHGEKPVYPQAQVLQKSRVSVLIRDNVEILIFAHIPLTRHPVYQLYQIVSVPLRRQDHWFDLRPDSQFLAVSEDHLWGVTLTSEKLLSCETNGLYVCPARNWREQSVSQSEGCTFALFRHRLDLVRQTCEMAIRSQIDEYLFQRGHDVHLYKRDPGSITVQCRGKDAKRIELNGFYVLRNSSECTVGFHLGFFC